MNFFLAETNVSTNCTHCPNTFSNSCCLTSPPFGQLTNQNLCYKSRNKSVETDGCFETSEPIKQFTFPPEIHKIQCKL